jgi:hypothetical protein
MIPQALKLNSNITPRKSEKITIQCKLNAGVYCNLSLTSILEYKPSQSPSKSTQEPFLLLCRNKED